MLENNSYPGRGIILGQSACGRYAALAYFIMGRSDNSRSRIFIDGGDRLDISIYLPERLSDPSLILYTPMRIFQNNIIITNGDQTDTVYDALNSGSTFEQALCTRSFEPDAPNFTPRISGIQTFENDSFYYKLSILKADDPHGERCARMFYRYEPCAGQGRLIHTYMCDGAPLPSFEGEPEPVDIPADIDEFARSLWPALDVDNKISLYVRYTDIHDPSIYCARLFNKLEGE